MPCRPRHLRVLLRLRLQPRLQRVRPEAVDQDGAEASDRTSAASLLHREDERRQKFGGSLQKHHRGREELRQELEKVFRPLALGWTPAAGGKGALASAGEPHLGATRKDLTRKVLTRKVLNLKKNTQALGD